MDRETPEGGSEIDVAAGDQRTADDELEARVESVLERIRGIAGEHADPGHFEALRAEVLELARSHAARAVLEAVTARLAARDQARGRRRPSRRW